MREPRRHLLAAALSLLLYTVIGITAAAQQIDRPQCSTAEQCVQSTLDAIARQDYETAHSLAWRVAQLRPKNDAAAMTLLARTQSLSGRVDDAFVMLRRLAEAGVAVADVETSDEFRRVREHRRWPQLQALILGTAAPPSTDRPDQPDRPDPRAARAAPLAPSAPAPSAPPAPLAPSAPSVLALPPSVTSPVAIAYDAVSHRFVVADESTNTLKIVSEASGHATDLVSPGWAGNYRTTAIAIDPRRGDLWVAGVEGSQSALHRLQLVSGRRLETISAPTDVGRTSFAALSMSADALFILDTAGRRVFSLAPGSQHLRVHASLPRDLDLLALAPASSALFISHTSGVMRIDSSSRGQRPVTAPKNIDVSGLHSLAWDAGVLYAAQQTAAGVVTVRVRLNARETAVVGVENIEPARSSAATLAGGVYHYLGDRPDGSGAAFRRLPTRK